ncbi:hypothetical protein, partial [Escherichia coli]|uniref:hypothetical protein n=1 Tax=Escherichia coli TaxID=562 RepID=UPI001BB06BEF
FFFLCFELCSVPSLFSPFFSVAVIVCFSELLTFFVFLFRLICFYFFFFIIKRLEGREKEGRRGEGKKKERRKKEGEKRGREKKGGGREINI